MAKIITLTMNPALDCASTTPRIIADGKLRCTQPIFEPGGGGINVSRAINKLGGDSIAIYPAGGSTGNHLTTLLVAEGVSAEPLSCEQWTRQNLNVVTTHDNSQYRFIMPGAEFSNEKRLALIELVKKYQDAEYCVISGSVAENLSEQVVTDVIAFCQKNNIKVIYDGSGASLEKAVNNGGLYLIKPNANELADLTNSEFIEPAELEEKARQIIHEGKAEIVLVSLGPQGALLITKDICEQVVPPRVQKNSTVGAGDSMVGATVLALADGLTIRQAVRRGVAAGTAATMNHGSELCKAKDVDNIYQWLLEKYPL